MTMTFTTQSLFYALLGGVLPALLWLWFWLKEDAGKPEPKGLIALSFFAGMVSVMLVYPMEQFASSLTLEGLPLLIAWAAIEETLKFAMMIIIIFQTSDYFDEPVDALVYMITVALGFAALENTLFLLEPISRGQALVSFLTGNLRFLGATLLHVIASSVIGVTIGFTFWKNNFFRKLAGFFGLCIAIALHTAFNFFIMKENGPDPFSVFLWLWVGAIIIIFLFERLKSRHVS
ncbi:MAG: PrsW family intramembrane metalloprotease [Candidatus Yonathbacteria bacterium]|nr:PrsW family intramembrane metalloprotease [Candidatus Yonathbacteria bacterium]